MSRTKSIVVVLSTTVVLLLPSTASAAKRYFSGKVEGGGRVSFATKFKHGKTRLVLASPPFWFHQVPISCEPGPELFNGYFGNEIKVRHSRFRIPAKSTDGLLKVTGKFRKRGTKAHGTFSYRPADDCDSPVHWNAHWWRGQDLFSRF